MKGSARLPLALIVSVASLTGLTHAAIAQDRPSEPIVYGCGTGCRVTAVRISDIETIQLANGSMANTALFESEQVRNYGTPEQYVASTQTPRYFAICSTRRVGANRGEDFVPNPDWWV